MQALLAYLDAGSGSYILAAIASGLAGIWFYLRSTFAKVFRRGRDAEVAKELGDQTPSQQTPRQQTPSQQTPSQTVSNPASAD